MISGIDLTAVSEYKIKSNGEEVTFKIGIVPTFMYVRLSNLGDDITRGEYLLRLALRGWDNFNVPFMREKANILGREIDAVPLDTIERIPPQWIPGLTNAVNELIVLSMGEIKNSN